MTSSDNNPNVTTVDSSEHVAPLTQAKPDGTPFVRRADVEKEISHALSSDQATWSVLASSLSSEAIVYLIRVLRARGEKVVCGALVEQLGHRIARIAKDWAKGFDPLTTDEIIIQVGEDIIAQILAPTPTRQSEFLEIAFRLAVKRRTLNNVDKRTHHPVTRQFAEAEAELLEDESPDPEAIAIASEQLTLNQETIRAGLAAIKDPRHRDAIILHYLEGWPITDKNRDRPTVSRQFGVTPRQISTWLKTALAQMREAIGEKYDQ